jgi:hypothetical protein
VLHSVIGDGRIPAALRSRFIEVLQTVGFDELARADTKMLGMALIFARDQARAISDERLIRRMGEILMGFAPVAASLANDEKAALPLLLALPNALMSVAVVPGNEAESAWRFFDLPSVCGALPTSGSPYLCSVDGVGEAPDIRAAG